MQICERQSWESGGRMDMERDGYGKWILTQLRESGNSQVVVQESRAVTDRTGGEITDERLFPRVVTVYDKSSSSDFFYSSAFLAVSPPSIPYQTRNT